MRIPIALIALALCSGHAAAADTAAPRQKAITTATAPLPDGKQIEKELQSLPWPRFRAVIETIPKLKADVDAYGAFGWEYVKANYKTHGWKKNVDRLDEVQKRQLVDLIRSAKAAK
jgi:hypothetical protein